MVVLSLWCPRWDCYCVVSSHPSYWDQGVSSYLFQWTKSATFSLPGCKIKCTLRNKKLLRSTALKYCSISWVWLISKLPASFKNVLGASVSWCKITALTPPPQYLTKHWCYCRLLLIYIVWNVLMYVVTFVGNRWGYSDSLFSNLNCSEKTSNKHFA